jgi:hypothetical protein
MKKFSVVCASALIWGATSAHANTLHEVKAESMTFRWKIEGNLMHGILRAKTTGWVAVGFNPSKGMKDASYVIGAEKDGKVKVENHFGTSERAHLSNKELGCKETITNAKGRLDGDFTEISFTIPTDTNDKCAKPLSFTQDTKVLLAYGSGKRFTFGHPFKTTMMVNLKTGVKK